MSGRQARPDPVEELRWAVDTLLRARAAGDDETERARTRLILSLLEAIHHLHLRLPWPDEVMAEVLALEETAELKTSETFSHYAAFCWKCFQRGKYTLVDKRVDPECPGCRWGICPVCNSCRDPRQGRCVGRDPKARAAPRARKPMKRGGWRRKRPGEKKSPKS